MSAWSSASRPDDLVRDLGVDGLDRLLDALAAPAALVAVAQLDRLVRAGRGARGDRRPAHASVLQRDVDFHGGIAAAVEDLAGVHVDDEGHALPSLRKRNDIGWREARISGTPERATFSANWRNEARRPRVQGRAKGGLAKWYKPQVTTALLPCPMERIP